MIFKEKDYDEWLDEKFNDTENLQKLLKPFPATQMNSHPVSTLVNSLSENSPDLILNIKYYFSPILIDLTASTGYSENSLL